jgi:RNA polymerase sigma-70 factor (ECF subfamily)
VAFSASSRSASSFASYLRDLTTAQAAREFNVPVGTVKSRVFYGLRMMGCIMQADTPAAA